MQFLVIFGTVFANSIWGNDHLEFLKKRGKKAGLNWERNKIQG